jgi:hypothetical protein
MSRRTPLWIALFVTSLFGIALLVAVPSLRLVWSKGYVPSRWAYVAPTTIEDFSTEFGWDATGRFYAVPISNPNRVVVVDRVDRQICPLGDGPMFRTGHWVQEADQTLAYEVRDWNPYGMNVSYQLDLTTWEVTVTTRGTCAAVGGDCRAVDPPSISTYSCVSF